MKKVFTIICFFAFSVVCYAQKNVTKISKNTNAAVKPEITGSAPDLNNSESLTLKETDFDFGKIPQGKPVIHVFEFKNTGNFPLSLEMCRPAAAVLLLNGTKILLLLEAPELSKWDIMQRVRGHLTSLLPSLITEHKQNKLL